MILINSSLIPINSGRNDVEELIIPVVDMAKGLGNVKVANIIALGAFVQRSRMVPIKILRNCIKTEFSSKPAMIPLNLKALDAGTAIALKN